jgi:hypothetical protein
LKNQSNGKKRGKILFHPGVCEDLLRLLSNLLYL